MMIQVDPTLALPVYEQIREQIVRMVVSGTIKPGTRLPTIRQLANDLHLAKGTVAKAYGMLEAAGVLETRGHRGSFVMPLADERAATEMDVGDALAAAADGYVVAARQLGVELETATRQLEYRWHRL